MANPVRPKMRRKPTPKKVSLEEKYKTSLSFLSMSLAELSHIRSELTRADMEDKNLPLGLLTDVREGRTCFVCLKVAHAGLYVLQLTNIPSGQSSAKLPVILSPSHLIIQS